MPAPPTVILSTIPFECPCCQRFLRVEAKHAGRLVRCPACRGLARVPGQANTPAVSADDPTTPLRPKTKPMRG